MPRSRILAHRTWRLFLCRTRLDTTFAIWSNGLVEQAAEVARRLGPGSEEHSAPQQSGQSGEQSDSMRRDDRHRFSALGRRSRRPVGRVTPAAWLLTLIGGILLGIGLVRIPIILSASSGKVTVSDQLNCRELYGSNYMQRPTLRVASTASFVCWRCFLLRFRLSMIMRMVGHQN